MDNSIVALKPVKDLLGMNFYIPDYQRGYRWTAQQATDLLEDIWTFAQKDKAHTEIYCIQPLVVQRFLSVSASPFFFCIILKQSSNRMISW